VDEGAAPDDGADEVRPASGTEAEPDGDGSRTEDLPGLIDQRDEEEREKEKAEEEEKEEEEEAADVDLEDPEPEVAVRSPLAYAAEHMRDDDVVVLTAIGRLPAALILASDALKGNRDVVSAAVDVEGGLLQHASEALRADTKLVILAVQTDIAALEYAAAAVVMELAKLVTIEVVDEEALALERRKPKLELMMTEKLMMRGEDDSVLRMKDYSKELLRITTGVGEYIRNPLSLVMHGDFL
jgi:hypothetical protein